MDASVTFFWHPQLQHYPMSPRTLHKVSAFSASAAFRLLQDVNPKAITAKSLSLYFHNYLI
jgi:hypothetical protein